MSVLPLRGEITGIASNPVLEFGEATGVFTGVHGCLVELLLVEAVLQDRDLRVMQVKGRRLRADLGQLSEVVAGRWTCGRPLERAAPTPWIVGGHLRVVPALPDVPEEDQR